MLFRIVILSILLSLAVGCPYLRKSASASADDNIENPHVFGQNNVNPGVRRKLQEQPTEGVHNSSDGHSERKLTQSINAASCSSLGGGRCTANKANTCYAYNSLKSQLSDYVAQLTAATSSSVLNLSTLYGAAVRLAFHDAGEANMASSSDMMGPDGCLSTSGDNAGLVESDSIVYTTFEPVWQGLCGKISRADFWVLLAKLCLETAEPTDVLSIPFQFGRKDATSCSAGADRLPSALGDLTEYRQVFVTQMGLTLADAVVLVGAHSLGHMHPDNSGFGLSGSCSDGYLNAWDDTPHIFDNHYHFNLEVHNWQNQLAPYRQTNSQAQWYSLVNANTIMMPSDLAIAYQLNFNYGSFTSQTCGPKGVGASTNRYTGAITLGTSYGCSPSNGTMPETCQTACLFGNTNSYFLTSFATSFVKMVCVGYGVPAQVDGATASGKIGTLTHIDLTTC